MTLRKSVSEGKQIFFLQYKSDVKLLFFFFFTGNVDFFLMCYGVISLRVAGGFLNTETEN